MNVVFVASEAVPFAKTGGLADVAGALRVPSRSKAIPRSCSCLVTAEPGRRVRSSLIRVSLFVFPLELTGSWGRSTKAGFRAPASWSI